MTNFEKIIQDKKALAEKLVQKVSDWSGTIYIAPDGVYFEDSNHSFEDEFENEEECCEHKTGYEKAFNYTMKWFEQECE